MISVEEMRLLEKNSGLPRGMLMENAGKGIAEALKQKLDIQNKRILVVAYHGNNAGDGFVAARHLCDDAEVDILFVGDEKRLKGETLMNFRKIENNEKVQILSLESVDFSDYDIIVDAILGTGVSGDIRDPLATLIRNLAKAKGFKVSIDVPTGVHPDTGQKSNAYFEPDLLITMHDLKKGLLDYKDKTVVVDIGIKPKIAE